MYTTEKIEALLIGSKTTINNKDFIGFIVSIDEKGEAKHSGIIISFLGKTSLFHYLPKGVFLEEIDLTKVGFTYSYKEITIVNKSLIRSFLNHRKVIKATAKPNFGYFYAGSYCENGVYHSDDNTPQLMTCVGFCINVVTGFLEEKSYIEFSDWVSVSQTAQIWLDNFLIEFKKEFPEVDEGIIRKNLRRIKPSELISSGYFGKLPIRKVQTDLVKPVVEEIFMESMQK
ncbi:MAG: hypothetical protein WC622_16660 [Pedobacter sp.]|jgi:hypothetical protein|uniref:hypothetical protein n=1 Tax=Pedobacter sp. TaxID=1411316 RepID=UPI003569E38D